MLPEHSDLWQRIRDFDLDGDALDPFSVRLARENGWSVAKAQRVIGEYKRFCFLAVIAGHPVAPSDAVDQAWHLHLIFTRSYWEQWCPQVLGCSLHHGPSLGGAQEHAKFDDWYARTLASYARIFEAEPPAEIWPSATAKSQASSLYVRVDLSRHLMLRVPPWLCRWWRRRWG